MGFYFANADIKEADILILGIGYDRTSSFISGSRFAPNLIREGAENIESYSPYQKKDLSEIKICDLGNFIFQNEKPEEFIKEVKGLIENYLKEKKKLVILGGEHTITYPIVMAFQEYYKNLAVIIFDGHSDLREDFMGEKVCHATVAKRILEIVGKKNLYQFGIRSLTKECLEKNPNLFLFEIFKPLKRVINLLKNKKIYLSLDLDVLDMAFLPAVQTPVAGGVNFLELVSSFKLLRNLEIVGVDIVEFSPFLNNPFTYASLCAEIVREILLIMK
ncbi:MAG: agmatinase [candidate division WOR-3 bacterium]|nr:agmatinase [candidate division WOR-3 bacterium]MCX7836444.1 agmatinase [candidate division WOR-3 bacterium]MDW8114210.1 agmatinase [candidate division WOR-3 bacterium]